LLKVAHAVVVIFGFFLSWISSAAAGQISAELAQALKGSPEEEKVPIIVRMAGKPEPFVSASGVGQSGRAAKAKRAVQGLRELARRDQEGLLSYLRAEQKRGCADDVRVLWIINGIALKAAPRVIRSLAEREDVSRVYEDKAFRAPPFVPLEDPSPTSPVEWNIKRVRAPEVWALGYDGTGVVVGHFDSGVDLSHPDLAGRYRGGANSWFDPYGGTAVPYDSAGGATGHGTHTLGIILGGRTGGNHIGVAPGATWIAAKLWDDTGESTSGASHEIFQWFLDPDGDPNTDDAPHAVNSSFNFPFRVGWCVREFEEDVRAWREAGIFSAFAAGNEGPLPFTGNSPANYAQSFSVGATGPLDGIFIFSGRGPSLCDLRVLPDVCAPGVAIRSSLPGGTFGSESGTSMACPHVTGTVALLLDANPALTISNLEGILIETAAPLPSGRNVPNNRYGWGRIDALRAVEAALLPSE
jgi:subtilisin family serine protease